MLSRGARNVWPGVVALDQTCERLAVHKVVPLSIPSYPLARRLGFNINSTACLSLSLLPVKRSLFTCGSLGTIKGPGIFRALPACGGVGSGSFSLSWGTVLETPHSEVSGPWIPRSHSCVSWGLSVLPLSHFLADRSG